MIKLFASDMDGTLLNPHHVISETTAQAIRDLQAQSDIEFLIATGRDYESAQRLLDQHGLSARIIAVNGAATYDITGQLEAVYPLEQAVNRTILDHFLTTTSQSMLTLKTLHGYYINDLSLYRQRMEVYMAQAQAQANEDSLAQFEAHFQSLKPLSDFQPDIDQPLKIMLIDHDPAVLAAAQEFLAAFDVDVTSSGPDNLEITSPQAQKGLAIAAYCQHHGFSHDQVLTIGDSANDRSMLAMFPNSYAMANANPAIQAIATHQAPSNADDGVAQVIYQLLDQLSH